VVLARHAGPVLERTGQRLGVRWKPDRPAEGPRLLLNWVLAVVVLLAAAVKALSVYPEAVNQSHFEEILPVSAVEFIREREPAGRLFNSYNWGAYIVWALPDYPVFVDGRTDLYDDEMIGQWFTVVRAEPGWEEYLDEWEINLVMIEPGLPIVAALGDAGWVRLYEDGISIVFER
jgi:hypothetical protein